MATLLVLGGLLAGSALMPQTASADHYDGYYYGDCYDPYDYDPYYDDDDDDDCYDPYDFDDLDGYPGFLSIVASPSTINCGATTTITVDIHLPENYLSGVTVGLSHNVPGTVKPASLVQSVNGRAVFTYTAPADWNGPVQIAASTEYEANSLTVQVNCKTGNPTPPQISVAAPASIQPPKTGDGGLK